MINTLLVEDDLYIQRHFVERFSEEEDIRIVAAVRDAFDAEGLCGQGGIDLVLMDVLTLHKHSGLAAGKRIREAYPNIKVLIVTSLVDPEVLQQARRGCASVSVPVLSNTMVSALANDSKYLAPLTITPILAASLMAVMTATEPVSLSAHE